MDEAIIAKGLYKRYKRVQALRGVTFKVPRGRVFGLLGPNGAGKSTTIKILVGLIKPDKGEALIFGKRAGSTGAKSLLGYAPERFSIGNNWRLIDFLVYVGRLHGLSERLAAERALYLLEWAGLSGYEEEKFGNLSAGMKKRFGLVQALISDPEILILDEPTEHLDAIGRLEVLNRIRELASRGKTILLSTHVLAEADYVVDSFAIMNRGRIIYHGSRLDVQGVVRIVVDKPAEFEKALHRAGLEYSISGNEFIVETSGVEDEKLVLRICLDNNIRVIRYDTSSSISDIFMRIVGAEKGEEASPAPTPGA